MTTNTTELAELIVRVLHLAAAKYPEESDLETSALQYADRIKELYGQYKRLSDFGTAARRARVEVVQEILANAFIEQQHRIKTLEWAVECKDRLILDLSNIIGGSGPCATGEHIPVIVSRCGGPDPKRQNTCGLCGQQILNIAGIWTVKEEPNGK